MTHYYSRIADKQLEEKLNYAGAVVIRGPKWCGKTETALQQAKSVLYMQDPNQRANNLMLADAKPSILLQGEKPRLIDEWQVAPQLWDAVRFAVDRGTGPGQFLLTGSSTPGEKPMHSGVGRFSVLDMLPMALYESRESSGQVSLAALFTGESEVEGTSLLDVEDFAHVVCRGGWPEAVTLPNQTAALNIARDYVALVAEEDISRVDDVLRSAPYARLIMQAYARCTSTQTEMTKISAQIKLQKGEISRATFNSYVAALKQLFLIQELSAWAPSLHAKSRITSTPTRHFVDPSLAAAALGATPEILLRDMSTFGLLFESLCVRDLRAYSGALGGQVFHYHDNTGLEADAVIVLPDGRYALLEAKMTSRLVDEGAENLLKLASKIDSSIMGAPVFCAVLTPSGYAYRRPDGVLVIPIASLKD